MVGDRVNVYPVKGYSITVCLDDRQSQEAAPQVSLLDDAAKIVTSRLGVDRFRVAGTAEFNGFNLDIRADRVKPLVDWSRRLFPGMSTRRVIPWAGLRPMLPDMMPTVRKSRTPGILYNTGHGHLGWTLSAATAQMATSLVEETACDTGCADGMTTYRKQRLFELHLGTDHPRYKFFVTDTECFALGSLA